MNTTRQRNDDQYVMPVEASRRGAHRARVSPLLGALPIVAVAVVVVGVVLLTWTLLGSGSSTTAQPAGGVSSAAPPAGAPSGGAPSDPAEDPAEEPDDGPADDPSGDPANQPAPTKEPAAGAVDKTLKIVVRNSTTTKGLARGAAAKLTATGWKINGIPDNYKPTIPTTVFYAEEGQKASALAVAQVLSIDLVKEDAAMAAKGVTVVLGDDYKR